MPGPSGPYTPPPPPRPVSPSRPRDDGAVEIFEAPTGQQIRTVVVDDEPWFVASDVAYALGYRDTFNAARLLEDEEKGTHRMSTPGGEQMVTVVSEPGLYRLVMRSNKPDAVRFQMWISREVLPAIRKTGAYSAQHALPQTFAQALELAARQARELEAANTALAVAEPKAEAWDVLASAEGDYSVRQAAFILDRDPAISTGQNRLFKTLRDLGMTDRGGMPYASHSQHLRLRATSYTDASTGVEVPKTQVRVTVAGVRYLHKRLGGIRQPAFTDLIHEVSA